MASDACVAGMLDWLDSFFLPTNAMTLSRSPAALAFAVAAGVLFSVLPAIATPVQLVWRGDIVSARAFMNDAAHAFEKAGEGNITLQPFSTISGLDAVASGKADLAGSARGKYDGRAEEANINFVPIALDAIVPITHVGNPVTNLTLQQLRDVYSGKITNWRELGGRDAKINLYSIAPPLDGVEFSMRQLVFGNGAARVEAPRWYLNTDVLEQAVTLDPSSLALSTLSSCRNNPKIERIAVESVAASPGTIADGSYPLFSTLYIGDLPTDPNQAAVDKFLAFLETPAMKSLMRRHDLVPYSDAGDIVAKTNARDAFIAAHLSATSAPVPIAAGSMAPVSAPRATLEARSRIAPTAESTQRARENLARAEAEKARKAATAKVAQAEKRESAAHADKKTPSADGKVAKAAAKAPKAKKPADFGDVKGEAKTKPVEFGNVNGGTSNSTGGPR